MPKITKKAKSVNVIMHEVIEAYSEYTCPACMVTFIGGGPGKRTTRFKCECGQELIVKDIKYINEGHRDEEKLLNYNGGK